MKKISEKSCRENEIYWIQKHLSACDGGGVDNMKTHEWVQKTRKTWEKLFLKSGVKVGARIFLYKNW
jgi:hypothetical protein